MIVVYDSEGKILYTVEKPYPEGIEDAYDDLAIADAEFNFIDNGTIEPLMEKYVDTSGTPSLEARPEMDLTYPSSVTSVDEINIVGVPAYATVFVDGSDIYTVGSTVETVDVAALDPGSYYFYIESWPYLPAEFTVSVTA